MKKPIIALIVLLIAAAASVGAFLGVKHNKDKEEKKKAEIAADLMLLSFDYENAEKVDIDCDTGHYKLKKVDDVWVIDDEENKFSVDQDYVNLLCQYAGTLEAGTSYPAENLAEYGLDNPGVITITQGGKDYIIKVGNISPTNDYYYIMVDGKDKVYTVSSLYGSVLKTQKEMIKSKKLVSYGDREIKQIIVKRDGVVAFDISFTPETDRWSLAGDYDMFTFDNTAASALAANLIRLESEIEEMREEHPDDLSKYGLDEPNIELIVRGIDGSEEKVLFNTVKDKTKQNMYVYMCSTEQVLVYNAYISFLSYSAIDFIIENSPIVDETKLDSFEYTLRDNPTEYYTIDYKGEKASVNGIDIDIKTGDIGMPFRNFLGHLAMMVIANIDTEASPELTDPVMTAKFVMQDGTEVLYQITDAGGDYYYAFINGKFTGALIEKDTITGVSSVDYYHGLYLKEAKITL